MKQLLFNAASSFIMGVFFCIGFFLSFEIMEIYTDDKSDRDGVTYVDQPEGFTFSNHSLVPERQNLTISTDIRNASSREWSYVFVKAKIYAGDAFMLDCSENLDHVPATGVRSFEVVCSEAQGVNLPDNINYELSVRRGGFE